MSDLRDKDPNLYEHFFREGVSAAEAGATSSHSAIDILIREDCNQARQDGFLARIAGGTSDKK